MGDEIKYLTVQQRGILWEFAVELATPKFENGAVGRWRAKSLEEAIRETYVGWCGEQVVCDETGGQMSYEIFERTGDKHRPGDVLTPDGLWIEVKTREFRNGVFGFHGDDPAEARFDVGALVEASAYSPGPGGQDLPEGFLLRGFASLQKIRERVYLDDFGRGRHWVCDPEVFNPWPVVRDFVLERRSGRRRRG